MTESQTIGKLAEALAKAQAQMGPAIKGAKNPFFKSTYARLEDVIEALRIPLSENGLSYVQPLEEDGDNTYLITKLMHSSGEWIAGRLKLIPTKKDMQGLAGAITYAKRYSLSAMVGLAEEDDDGSAAIKPDDLSMHHKPIAPIKPNSPTVVVADKDETFRKQQLRKKLSALMKEKNFSADVIQDYTKVNFSKEHSVDFTEDELEKTIQFVLKMTEPAPWEVDGDPRIVK